MRETQLNTITLTLCDLCLDGEGGECHFPGCALFLNRAPDLSLRARVALEASLEDDNIIGWAVVAVSERRKRLVRNAILEDHEAATALMSRIATNPPTSARGFTYHVARLVADDAGR